MAERVTPRVRRPLCADGVACTCSSQGQPHGAKAQGQGLRPQMMARPHLDGRAGGVKAVVRRSLPWEDQHAVPLGFLLRPWRCGALCGTRVALRPWRCGELCGTRVALPVLSPSRSHTAAGGTPGHSGFCS